MPYGSVDTRGRAAGGDDMASHPGAIVKRRRRWAVRGAWRRLGAWAALALLAAAPLGAAARVEDLNGDGAVDDRDLGALLESFGSTRGDAHFQARADLDADGDVDAGDASLLQGAFGRRGAPDTQPPHLEVTLEHVPDGMNDLLVVPPEGFRITLRFDPGAGSLIDAASLTLRADRAMGPHPAGAELASFFQVTATQAIWQIPVGSDLARTTVRLTGGVRDRAGNQALRHYAFAVRDFAFGAPLARLQVFHVDFGADRSRGPRPDFVEDLRSFGLSSALAPGPEAAMRSRVEARILEKLHLLYGRHADGSAAADSAHVVFVGAEPDAPHARICVGGESPLDPALLGAVQFDENNLIENDDACASPEFGVFPQALDDLWWDDPDFLAAFAALNPDTGGIPVGEHPLDAAILDPEFAPDLANPSEARRFDAVTRAVDAFSGAVATVTAHEVAHLLGLVAEGPTPGGLFGDSQNHNRDPDGNVPAENYVMNPGSSFRFAQVAGLSDAGLPRFRPLNWAYLRDRIAPNPLVTALYPAPALLRVEPAVVVFRGDAARLTLRGAQLSPESGPPLVELIHVDSGESAPVRDVVPIDDATLTLRIERAFVAPGRYDVSYVGGDGQVATLAAGLEVR